MTSPTHSRDDLLERLETLAVQLVRAHAIGAGTSIVDDSAEAMAPLLEALAAARGATFQRYVPERDLMDNGEPIFNQFRQAQTARQLNGALSGVTDHEYRLYLLTHIAERHLVTPDMLQAAAPEGMVDWNFYASRHEFTSEARACLDRQLLRLLADPMDVRVVPVLRMFSQMSRLGDAQPTDPLFVALMAYAEGRAPGVMPSHQRLAAMVVMRTPWVGPSVLETVVRLSVPEDGDAVKLAVQHPNADERVWRAAVLCPSAWRVAETLSRIPRACQDAETWPGIFRAMSERSSTDAIDGMVRLLKTASPDAMDPVLTELIERSPKRASMVLARLPKSRLHAISPATLLPLMTSANAQLRTAMVSLMGSVGQSAPVKARGRRSAV